MIIKQRQNITTTLLEIWHRKMSQSIIWGENQSNVNFSSLFVFKYPHPYLVSMVWHIQASAILHMCVNVRMHTCNQAINLKTSTWNSKMFCKPSPFLFLRTNKILNLYFYCHQTACSHVYQQASITWKNHKTFECSWFVRTNWLYLFLHFQCSFFRINV